MDESTFIEGAPAHFTLAHKSSSHVDSIVLYLLRNGPSLAACIDNIQSERTDLLCGHCKIDKECAFVAQCTVALKQSAPQASDSPQHRKDNGRLNLRMSVQFEVPTSDMQTRHDASEPTMFLCSDCSIGARDRTLKLRDFPRQKAAENKAGANPIPLRCGVSAHPN